MNWLQIGMKLGFKKRDLVDSNGENWVCLANFDFLVVQNAVRLATKVMRG
jgi:hypothetical protein